jgi:hypothetical protein
MNSDATRQSARRVGLGSTAVIVVVALVIAALLDPGTFAGPVATFVLCYLPVQIVLAGMWAHHPDRLTGMTQPARGGILLVAALVVAAVAELVFLSTVGAGRGPSTPQIAMFTIVVVVTTFWLAVVFEGWPFARISNGIVASAALLLTIYVVALLVFYLLFDFSFLPPPAQTPQTPSGAFDAWHVLTFLVTAISGMFVPPAFGFLGFDRLHQPVRGLAWTGLLLVWAGMLFGIGVGALGADPVDFLVWVSVPLLFGGLIILVVFRDSLFGGLSRPTRGVSNVLAMAVLGVVLVWVYQRIAGLASPPVSWGPPTYQGQVWIASATLAFTFPLLATHADFFDHWPLRTRDPVPAVGTDAEELPGI